MINLAGNENCDEYIKKELDEAGIHYEEFSVLVSKSEVPSKIIAYFNDWSFRRAWYYWVAKASNGTLLLFEYADRLHESHGKVVRVSGHCGCPSPREWYKHPWQLGVDLYHIDTQEGLNAFVAMLKEQCANKT